MSDDTSGVIVSNCLWNSIPASLQLDVRKITHYTILDSVFPSVEWKKLQFLPNKVIEDEYK